MRTPCGSSPTGTVATTLRAAVSTTETTVVQAIGDVGPAAVGAEGHVHRLAADGDLGHLPARRRVDHADGGRRLAGDVQLLAAGPEGQVERRLVADHRCRAGGAVAGWAIGLRGRRRSRRACRGPARGRTRQVALSIGQESGLERLRPGPSSRPRASSALPGAVARLAAHALEDRVAVEQRRRRADGRPWRGTSGRRRWPGDRPSTPIFAAISRPAGVPERRRRPAACFVPRHG